MRYLSRSLGVLELFTADAPAWGVSAASRAVGLPKSTVSELMTSLADEGLLRRANASEYRLGWRLMEFGRTQRETSELNGARETMIELAQTYHETVHLAALEGQRTVYLAKVQPKTRVLIDITYPGARLPTLHCSSVGKVLLAAEPGDRVHRHLPQDGPLKRYTGHTVVDRRQLTDQLDEIREVGHAYDLEEIVEGLCCVAAPVCSEDGSVIAALSLSVPETRFGPNRGQYTEAVTQAAARLSISAARQASALCARRPS